MKEFWNVIQMVFTAVGGWLGYFLGGNDGLLIALVVFAVVDYVTGVMCAVSDKKLNSQVDLKESAGRDWFSCWWGLPTSWTCRSSVRVLCFALR